MSIKIVLLERSSWTKCTEQTSHLKIINEVANSEPGSGGFGSVGWADSLFGGADRFSRFRFARFVPSV